jgi:FkbM family methyltransferase
MTMKRSLKNGIGRFAIRSLSSMLPVKIMDLIVSELLAKDRLVSRHGFYYLTNLAEKLNVVALSVRGDYGTFVGASTDTAILRRYAETGKWAENTNNLIMQFFDGKAGTYLDIGANIGLTIVPIATNTSVVCHAFEPEPASYRNLVQNISENCPNANVKSHQLALFDRKAKLPFEIAEENLGDHRIHIETGLVAKQGEIGRKVIDVCAVPLDDLHLRIKGPLLIKIDTQGAEPFVFSGGKATLSKADLIVVEWSPYHMARVGGDPMVVINFLQREFSFVKIIATDVSQTDILPTGGEKQMFDFLKQTIQSWRDDPQRYVDVVVSKKKNIMLDLLLKVASGHAHGLPPA